MNIVMSEQNAIAVAEHLTNTIKTAKGKTGGGAATNLIGKAFEAKTDIKPYLLEHGFIKLPGSYKDVLTNSLMGITYAPQTDFKKYMSQKGVNIFRMPDEAYINEITKTIYILEKKAQTVEGTAETKLWSGPSLKREYEMVIPDYKIKYGFCVNGYLGTKLKSSVQKYVLLCKILQENDIEVLHGDMDDYVANVLKWAGLPYEEPSAPTVTFNNTDANANNL